MRPWSVSVGTSLGTVHFPAINPTQGILDSQRPGVSVSGDLASSSRMPIRATAWAFLKPKNFKAFGNLPKLCSPEPYSTFSFIHKEAHPGCHTSVTKKPIYRSQKGKDIHLGTFLKLWTRSLSPFWQVLEPTCQVLRLGACLYHGINCVKLWGPVQQQPRKHPCTPTVLGNPCTGTHCDFLCI